MEEMAVEFVYSRQQENKDLFDYVKIWVKVIFVTFCMQ